MLLGCIHLPRAGLVFYYYTPKGGNNSYKATRDHYAPLGATGLSIWRRVMDKKQYEALMELIEQKAEEKVRERLRDESNFLEVSEAEENFKKAWGVQS